MFKRARRILKIRSAKLKPYIYAVTLDIWFRVITFQYRINDNLRKAAYRWIIRPSKSKILYLNYHKRYLSAIFPLFLITITVAICMLLVFWFSNSETLETHFTGKGEIGDTIGGLTGPLIGILNAILLWWTLRVQNRHNSEQIIRSSIERNIDGIDRQIDKCKLTHSQMGINKTIYYGSEAIFKARSDIEGDRPTIGGRIIDETEWQVFLMSIQTILRLVSSTLDFLDEVDQSHPKKVLATTDIISQASDAISFANSYSEFVLRSRKSDTDVNTKKLAFERYQEIYRSRLDEIFHHVGMTI